MSGISAMGASLQGPVKMTGAAAGGAAAAASAGAGQTASANVAGHAPNVGQAITSSQVHQQVHHMLGQIDSSLQLDHTLKLLVAAIILQALAGSDNNDGPMDTAAALIGASAASSAITGLAALSHQTAATGGAAHATAGPASVQATPYAQQATDLPQQQTVNLQA